MGKKAGSKNPKTPKPTVVPYGKPGGKNPMAGAVAASKRGKTTKVPYGK